MQLLSNCLVRGAVSCLLVTIVFVTSTSFAQSVTNGGFESSTTGVVAGTDVHGWVIQVAATIAPPPVFEVVSDSVEQGSRALKVTLGGAGTNQWDIQIVADRNIPVHLRGLFLRK